MRTVIFFLTERRREEKKRKRKVTGKEKRDEMKGGKQKG